MFCKQEGPLLVHKRQDQMASQRATLKTPAMNTKFLKPAESLKHMRP